MIEQFQKQLQIGSWVLVAVFVMAGVWLWQSVGQLQRTGNVSDTIMVSGTGKVLAKPDVAVAELAISVESATAKAAQDQANKKSQAVVTYLKNAGITDKDINTSGYTISPQYDYQNGRSNIRGYQVTQSLTVKIRNLDKANTVLDGVVTAGVNQVNNFRFEIDEPEKLKAEARTKAIADANAKADELKRELGISLGHIVSFTENTGGFPGPYYLKGAATGIGGSDSVSVPPALPTGENEITVDVTITYQIR